MLPRIGRMPPRSVKVALHSHSSYRLISTALDTDAVYAMLRMSLIPVNLTLLYNT
jgi:hypothetical protein